MNRIGVSACVVSLFLGSALIGCGSFREAVVDTFSGSDGADGLGEFSALISTFGGDTRFAEAVTTADALNNLIEEIQRREMDAQEREVAQTNARATVERDFEPEVRETYARNQVFVAVPQGTKPDEQGVRRTEYVIADAKTGELVSNEAYVVPTESAAEVSQQSQRQKRPVSLGQHRVIMMPPEEETT